MPFLTFDSSCQSVVNVVSVLGIHSVASDFSVGIVINLKFWNFSEKLNNCLETGGRRLRVATIGHVPAGRYKTCVSPEKCFQKR